MTFNNLKRKEVIKNRKLFKIDKKWAPTGRHKYYSKITVSPE